MKYGELTLGQIEALINKVGGMNGVNRILVDDVTVVPKDHIIDCDASPFVPNGWKLHNHRKGGQLKWDAKDVALSFSPNQQCGRRIQGQGLLVEILSRHLKVLNANVLDYLLAHPHLIPDSWKYSGEPGRTRVVFFWGTTYEDESGNRCVRNLFWNSKKWAATKRSLSGEWYIEDPAAISAI